MTSDVLPPNNSLRIWHKRVDIEEDKEELQSLIQLKPAHQKFFETVAHTAQQIELGSYKN